MPVESEDSSLERREESVAEAMADRVRVGSG